MQILTIAKFFNQIKKVMDESNYVELPSNFDDGGIVDVVEKISDFIKKCGYMDVTIFSDGSVSVNTNGDPDDALIHDGPSTFAISVVSG